MSLQQWPTPRWMDMMTEAGRSKIRTDDYNFFHSECNRMDRRIQELEAELAEARQTIEDIAIGVQMECSTCGKYHPCNCDK